VVVIALGVEQALEVVGIRLADVGAEASGKRVAEADDEVLRGVLSGRRGALRGWLWGGGAGGGRGGGGSFGSGGRLATREAEAGGERGQSDKSDTG
jgi:hypothetical protein